MNAILNILNPAKDVDVSPCDAIVNLVDRLDEDFMRMVDGINTSNSRRMRSGKGKSEGDGIQENQWIGIAEQHHTLKEGMN